MNILIVLISGLIIASYFIFFIWMVVDAIRSGKFLWLLGILAVPIIGVTVYFFVEKRHEYMKLPAKEGTK